MFKVELIEEIKKRGVFRYRVAGLPIEGQSRQPLLDACREIKRILGPTEQRAGLFREGRSSPDLSCTVEWGAAIPSASRQAPVSSNTASSPCRWPRRPNS